MPHLPQEEETSKSEFTFKFGFRTRPLQTADITDQVAKESSDSNASDHKLHADAHKGNLGPVKADNLPEPESKEALKKRAEELNK